jgi:glutathione S-transferase
MTSAKPVITAFDWVPDFAKGLVRDLRIRWAFEELGVDYEVELFGARSPRPEKYVTRQPFEQVPAFRDDEFEIFETGAILLYLAEKHGKLMPSDPQARWQATSWLFAALNSVEPALMRHAAYVLINPDKDWSERAREVVEPLVRAKLKRVDDALAGKDWLVGEFSMADLMMVSVLNNIVHGGYIADFPALAAYHERGKARPAYQRALAAQMADYTGSPPTSV